MLEQFITLYFGKMTPILKMRHFASNNHNFAKL